MLTAEATTALLMDLRRGEIRAHQALQDGLYEELREIAGSLMRRHSGGMTLQATALVHEAWIKLGTATGLEPRDRAHFLAIAATAMRQILVDHARARSAAKRGGDRHRLEMETVDLASDGSAPIEVLLVDECLTRLATLDARQAQVVEMRVFAGMTVEETAEALRVSPRTVELDWRMARAWLVRELAHADE